LRAIAVSELLRRVHPQRVRPSINSPNENVEIGTSPKGKRWARPVEVRQQKVPPGQWKQGDRGQVAAITLGHAVNHVYGVAVTLSIPFAVADFHVSYELVGVLLAISGVIGGGMQILAGLKKVRRLSARFLLSAQNAVLAGCSLLAAAAPGLYVYGAANIGGSLAGWPQHPIGNAYLVERFPERRGLVVSWHNTGGNIGTLAVPLLFGLLVDRFGWRWSLVVFSAVIMLGAILVWVYVPHNAATGRQVTEEEQSSAASPAAVSSLRRTLLSRNVLLVLVASSVAAGGRGLGVLTVYVPAYLRSGLHLSGFLVGAIFSAVAVGAVFGAVAAGWLSDRIGRRSVLLCSYVMGAAAIVGFVSVGDHVAALAAIGLFAGVFAYAESPILQSLFSDVTRAANARSSFGWYFAIAYGVGALWQLIIGVLVTHFGFPVAFDVMAGSFVMAAALVLWIRPDPGGENPPQAGEGTAHADRHGLGRQYGSRSAQ
jgi:MFS family permease